MAFIRKIKKKSGTYLVEVENYREDGKVKQRVIKYLGVEVDGKPERRIRTSDIDIEQVKEYMHFHAIHSIAKELELPALLGEGSSLILLMVYSHLAEKLSLNKLKSWIEKTELPLLLGIQEIGSNALYEALDALESLNFDLITDHIAEKWYSQYNESKDSAIFIDVTDTYFNGSEAEWKKRKGKDGKYDKLVQIGLAVSSGNGFPLLHRMYEGNISNSKIMSEFLSEVKMLGVKSIVIDRGMVSEDNLTNLDELNVLCIAGLKGNPKLERLFLDKIKREEIFTKSKRIELKETVVYAESFDYKKGKLIVIFNPEIEVQQRNKLLATNNPSEDSLRKMKYFGYSFLYHTTDFETNNVVNKYFEKDTVEKSFRQIKGVLSLHPIRVRLLERVSAHIKICYLSYCILSLMNYKLKKLNISAISAIDELSTAQKVYLEDKKNNYKWSKVVTLKKSQEKILKALGVNSL